MPHPKVSPAAARPVRKLWRPEHVGTMLDVSTATIYELAKQGRIKSVTIGRRRLFREADVDAFIDSLAAEAVAFGHPHES